ncbi:MAG: hypothetical protein AB2556_22370 [Candidatus Thiodiazotropha sp.]
MVTIPGPLVLDDRPDQQELVLNDVVEVPLQYTPEVLDGKWSQDWALGYALTVHASQCLTIVDPQKVWIIDDYLQWSDLTYLAISRVEYLRASVKRTYGVNYARKLPPYAQIELQRRTTDF